jgi:hypothetical protein
MAEANPLFVAVGATGFFGLVALGMYGRRRWPDDMAAAVGPVPTACEGIAGLVLLPWALLQVVLQGYVALWFLASRRRPGQPVQRDADRGVRGRERRELGPVGAPVAAGEAAADAPRQRE